MASKEIFYVGDAPEETFPWGHLGTFVIKGREPGERMTRLTVHDKLDREDHGDGKISRPVLEGAHIAEKIALAANDRGVFCPKGVEPTEAEVAEAEARRDKYRLQLVDDADSDYSRHGNPKNIPTTAKRAAMAMGLTRDWLSLTVSLSNCPFCHSQVHPEASVCPKCTRIVNASRYAAEMTKQAQEIEAATKSQAAGTR